MFDLGGVLTRICRTWQEAARAESVQTHLSKAPVALDVFPFWNGHERGEISDEEYLSELGAFLGCTLEEAKRVHCGIPYIEYEGVNEVVQAIHQSGVRTGCLSNTNAMHWEHLRSARFPAIAALQCAMPSHLTGFRKPDPAIFRHYVNEFQLSPERVVYFDDLPANVAAAAMVGWRSHWIDPNGDTAAQIQAILVSEGWHRG